MTPHLPRLCAVAVGLRLLACDGGGGPAGASDAGPGGGSLDGAADAHLPDTADARMRPLDCPAIRLSNGSLTLRECPETGELALATTPDGPVALRIQIRAEGPGEPLTPESLPGIAWRVAPPDVAVVRYTGENGPSPLESPDGDAALSLTVKLEGDRVLIRGALGWPAAAMFPGPYRPVVRLVPALGAPRSLGHGVFAVGTPSGALLLLSGAPEAGPELAVTAALGSVFAQPAEVPGLAPGSTWTLPTVEIDVGATRFEAQRLWAEHHATPTGPAPQWGWRSGPTLGSVIAATTLQDAARRLVRPDLSPPVLLVDGRWFDRYGADSPSPAFPAGVAGAVATVRQLGAVLALRWSPLALRPPPNCADCSLDAREPAVRDAAARRAEQLFRAGVAALLVELPDAPADAGVPPPPVPNDLFAALRPVAGRGQAIWVAGSMDSFPAPQADTLMLIAPADGPTGACTNDVVQASQDVRCAAALRAIGPLNAEGSPSAAVDAPTAERLGRALADAWMFSAAGHALSLGGISVGDGTPGQARTVAALSALAGGLHLLSDNPATLAPDRLALFLAPIRRGVLRWPAAQPGWLNAGPDAAPDIWHRPGAALAVVNGTDAPFRAPSVAVLAPELAGRPLVEVFSGEAVDADTPFTVPPRDVRLVVPVPN